jgi:VCBS repeat-containing protein
MAKQYKVLVNTAKEVDNFVLDVPQPKGGKVEPLRIPAKLGHKYQLQETSSAADKPRAPDYVKTRRVGKDLHVVFEGDREASLIIEGYYDVATDAANSLIGQAENGSFYDYIPEDPQMDGLVANLRDGGEAINIALGGSEVQGAGAEIGLLAATPFLGVLGLVGAGAAAVVAANAGGTTTTTPTGRLAPVAPNDSSALGDNLTNDNTPTITGAVPVGSTATMTLNGKTYPVTVNTDGTYSFTIPDADKLPDGTYTPRLNVISGGTTTSTDVTPFTIDTVTNVAITNPGTSGTTNPISGTAEAGDVVLLKDPSCSTLGSTTANSAGQWTFTPTANVSSGSVSATVTDPAGNTATANGNNNSTDSTAPTVSVTSDKTSLSSTQTAAITFTLSESSTDFTAADVTVTGGALSNFTGSGTSYSATFTPTAGATSAALLVDSNKFSDAAGNFNKDGAEANNSVSMSISNTPADTTPPTISVSTDKTSLASNQTATITFTLSESSTDFTAADVTVIGGTLSNFTGSGTSYTATFTPTAGATSAALLVASDKFSDAAGNLNKDGADTNNTVSMSISNTPVDITAPTISVSTDKASLSSNQTATITFTLSESSTDFTVSDVTVIGGTLSNFTGSGTSYTATFTPTAGATSAVLTVASDKFSDAAGNFNKDGADTNNSVSMSISNTPADTTPPTISVSTDKTSLASNQTATITFTLSESSTDFTAADVTVIGGTLSNFTGSGTSYSATFTPTAGATSAVLTVASDKFSDAAGNFNKDGADTNNTVSMSISNTPADTTPPTISVSTDKTSLASNQTATITFTLSESSTDFTANDVTVIGGTLSNFTGSGTSYTATFTPNANTTSAALTVASDKFTDAAGNLNKDGADTNNAVSMSISNTPVDTTSPTISVSTDKTSLASNQTATITFNLSESSVNFAASDVTVIGGALSNFTGSGTSYTATFTPNENATSAAVIVASDRFTDAAGNLNKDGADTNNAVSMSISNTPVETTSPTISVSTDKTSLASNQTATITFTLSESSTDFTANDVTVIGGTLSNFQGSGTSYTATFTPTAGATSAALTVASDKFSDVAGNLNKDGADTNNSVSMSISNTPADTTPPTISVSTDKTTLTSSQTATITFTLSESSTDFTANDVTVIGGALSNFTGSGTSYTATFTPNENATSAAVIVASDRFTDAAGNLNKDGADLNNTVSLSIDKVPPAATTGKLSAVAPNDSGTLGDNTTNDTTPTITGTVPAGSTATITLNGKNYPITVNADGTYSFTIPDADKLPDGTYTPKLNVTTNGTTTSTDVTPFTIDTVTNVAISTPGTGGTTNPISGTSEAGDIVVLKDNAGNVLGSTTANSDGQWSFTPTSAVPTGDVQAMATDAAGNTANATGKNAAKLKTALTIDPVFSDNIVTTTEGAAFSYNVTGKVTGTFAAGDIVTLVLNGKNYTAVVGTDGSYSAPVAMADLKADSDTKIEGTVTGTSGSLATAAQDYVVETTANAGTQTALSIDPVTADNILGSTESTGNIPVTGKVTGKFSAGDTLTLTVNGKTFTGTVAANGTYSVNEPAADLLADSDTKIDATITGNGGTAATAVQDYGVDPNINPAPATLKTALTINPITGDNIVNTTEGAATSLIVTGKVTGTFVGGDTVTLVLNGKNYTAVVGADGSYSTAVSMADLKADSDTKIEGTVTATNGSLATAAQDYVVETTANAGTQTALSINPVTADNILGSTESSGNIAVTGKVTGKFSAGDTVTLVVNGKNFTGSAAADGSYSINVPASDLLADTDTQVDGSVTGTGGAKATAVQDYGVDANINPADTTAPTIVVARSGTASPLTGSENITFTLSEASTNFALSDIDVSGGTLSNFAPVPTSGTAGAGFTQYTATFKPNSGSGTATIGVASGKFADNAGNVNLDTYQSGIAGTVQESNNSTSITFNTGNADTTPPTIIVARAGTGTINTGGTETITFTVSENTFLAASDVVVTGGALSNFEPVISSGDWNTGFTQYTATFTPTVNAQGTVTIGVANGKFADGAGNINVDTFQSGVSGTVQEANNQVSIGFNTTAADTTAPTVAVTRAGAGTVTTTGETVYFTLSEASTNFTASDVDVTGGTVNGFAPVPSSGNSTTGFKQFTATFTPATGAGVATVGVKSGQFSDAAGNNNTDTYVSPAPSGAAQQADNQVSLDYNTGSSDTNAPTVAVTRSGNAVLLANGTETITFVLSEASTDFSSAEISVTGGTLSNFQGSGTTYTATFTPTANALDTGVIGLTSGKFSDAAGNSNKDTFLPGVVGSTQEANNSVAIGYNTVPASAPTVSADTVSATEAGGTSNGTTFVDPTGNVLSNDTAVTAVLQVQDIKAGTGAGTATAVNANSTSTSSGTTVNGTFGTLVIGADGSYKYTPNNANTNVQALRTSTDTVTDVFTYTVKDGNGKTSSTTLTATISGSNDAPVVSVQQNDQTATIGTAFNYSVPILGVPATFTDVDSGDSLTYTATLEGGGALPSWLSFDASTKTFSGTPPSGTTVGTLNVTVTATDKGTLSASDTFSISVGNNNAPTLSTITALNAVTEATNAIAQKLGSLTGTLSVNDVDNGNTVTASTTAASAVYSGGATLPSGVDVSALIASSALTFGAGVTPNGTAGSINWTYNPSAANLDWLPKGQTLTLTYPVTVSDGQGGTAKQNLVITVTGTNDAPTASAISQSFNKGAAQSTIHLLNNAADADQGETATLKVDSSFTPTFVVTTDSSNGTAQASSTTLPAGVIFDAAAGTLKIDPSNSTISTGLASGQKQTIVASYKIIDAQGATVDTTATLVINGSGSNDPVASNDTATATEAGGSANGTAGTNPTGNVLTNDSIVVGTKTLQDVKLSSASTATAVTAGSTSSSNATTITGSFGSLVIGANGSYTYNVDNANSTVQALRTSSNTLTDNFTYTLKDGQGGTSTATLAVTVQGANDAPVAVADTATAKEAGGSANGTAGTDPTGNVLNNDTDVDKDDTKVVQDAKAGTTGSVVTVSSGSTSTSSAATITGTFGALKLGADGSYSYVVDNANTTVQALKSSTDTVTDTFTYTVKDAAGATSSNTITVTVQGANDAPAVSIATSPSSTQTNLQAFNFGTAFSLADMDVGTGTMTLTLSSNVNDGRITVTPGTSGATITSGNGTNSVVISGTLAQLQALTGTASNYSFVDSASQTAKRDVTISALLNDNGNQGGTSANALTGSNSFTVSMAADPNASAKIDITAISTDSGVSTTDYITFDNTLVYSGTVSSFTNNGDKVKLELLDSKGTVVASTTVTPTLNGSNGTWTWNDPVIAASSTRADGIYTLRATIVDPQGDRVAPATTVGSNTGTQDVQAVEIDTNTPNVDPNKDATIDIVRIDDALSSTTAATGSKDTGASSTDFVTSDGTLKYFGTLTGFDGTKNDLVKLDFKDSTGAVLRSVFVTPTLDTATNSFVWTWDDTANNLASGSYTLVATIVDQAGNVVNTKAPVNGTNGGTDSQLIVIDSAAPTQTVTFSSMTKDTGTNTVTTSNTSANANWTTADASAGRLVSGSISAKLGTNDVVEVFANDGNGAVMIGNAVVNGTHWAITDTLSHVVANANSGAWTYSAKVSNLVGSGTTKTQTVLIDTAEDAPVITAIVDTANTTVASNTSTSGSTTNGLSKVSGTGTVGSTIYLYDNSQTNLVGSTTVDSTGKWTVNLSNLGGGSNTFAAVSLDNVGNPSVFSNLVTATSGAANGLTNGDFSSGSTGFITTLTELAANGGQPVNTAEKSVYKVQDISLVNVQNVIGNNSITTPQTGGGTFTNGTWSTKFRSTTNADVLGGLGGMNPDGAFKGNVLTGQASTTGGEATLWSSTASVVSGKTYTFTMDYSQSTFLFGATPVAGEHNMRLVLDGQKIDFTKAGETGEAGHLTVTYTATETKTIVLALTEKARNTNGSGGDFMLDNFRFVQALPSSDNTLVAGKVFGGATPNDDDTLSFSEGALTALAGDDVITVASTQLQAKLAAGSYIDGDAGVDTLKLAAGTVIDLDQLTRNQTVKSIQEVEIFQLQGGSTLSLSANDVLSLGGSNASTMSDFSPPSAGSGTGFDSTGKVQFVVKGTSSDKVNLLALQLDGVLDSAGELGNTGLAGQWSDVGTTTIGGVVYQVFNHSTTQAQVLISNAAVAVPTNSQTVAITSATVNSTSFTQEFVAPLVTTSKTQKSVTTDDSNWTISATGANGQTLPTLDPNNGNVGFYVSIGERWTALAGTELNLGEQTTQTVAGGRREYTFKSNAGTFDFIEFHYTDTNFNSDLWINFFDATGKLIDRTQFVPAINRLDNTFSYSIKNGALASSFMIDMNTDDTWGLDKLRTGVQQGTFDVASGGSAMDGTPLLKGVYSANLATGEVIAIYDGSTKLGTATVDVNTKTWTFQVSSDLSATTHTFTAKVESSTGTATATSSNFTLSVLASPLALDLNGDGVQTIGAEQGVQFDLLNTGAKQSVGWVDKQDGFLVMDLNHDGVVNNGSELLGSSTQLADGSLAKDGWQALTQHDVNADGFINTKDAAFLDLKVWVDANSNGVTDAGELQTLSDVGIQSINLAHNNVQTAQNGNILQGFSSFTTTDGASHDIVDAWLKVDDSVAVTPSLNGPLEFVTPTGVVAATKPFDLSALLETDGLPLAGMLVGAPWLDTTGEAKDTVQLSDLLQTGPAQGHWQPTGSLLDHGVAYNSGVHSGSQSLTALVDQHVQHVSLA